MEGEARQQIFGGGGYQVGEFVCPASSARWREENQIFDGPLFVFPLVPVEIRASGAGTVHADLNQILFYNDGQRYHRRLLDGRGDHCVFVRLDPVALRDVLLDCGLPIHDEPSAPFRFFRAAGTPHTFLQHLAISRYAFKHPDFDALFLEESLLLLLREVLTTVGTNPPSPTPRRGRAGEAVRAVQERLSTRYDEPASLAQLAEAVDLSPFHLARTFREWTGVSIHIYRERLRLLNGLVRSLDGERLVDVALDVGYSSHSHFTSAFRRTFGRPPSEVRGLLAAAGGDARAVAELLLESRTDENHGGER